MTSRGLEGTDLPSKLPLAGVILKYFMFKGWPHSDDACEASDCVRHSLRSQKGWPYAQLPSPRFRVSPARSIRHGVKKGFPHMQHLNILLGPCHRDLRGGHIQRTVRAIKIAAAAVLSLHMGFGRPLRYVQYQVSIVTP